MTNTEKLFKRISQNRDSNNGTYALVISSRSFFRLNSISATLCSRVLCSSGICSFLSGLAYYGSGFALAS
jgi:hypothetical protein